MDAKIPWILFVVASCLAAVSIGLLLTGGSDDNGTTDGDERGTRLTEMDVLNKALAQLFADVEFTPSADQHGGGCQVAAYWELIDAWIVECETTVRLGLEDRTLWHVYDGSGQVEQVIPNPAAPQ
jgi:hypothetical protein